MIHNEVLWYTEFGVQNGPPWEAFLFVDKERTSNGDKVALSLAHYCLIIIITQILNN